MSSRIISVKRKGAPPNRRLIVAWAAVVVLLGAMAISTKVVRLDSDGSGSAVSSAGDFGATEFPKVQSAIVKHAVSAAALAAALAKDQAAAVKQYGVAASVGPEFPVKFTGTVGKADFGSYAVTVKGVPKALAISVRTGPAVLGTDLRDATGAINFGQFTNQIEYQNAGSALNKEMKKEILSKIDTSTLSGKTISVVGAFQLTDPHSWLVTPVKLDVQ